MENKELRRKDINLPRGIACSAAAVGFFFTLAGVYSEPLENKYITTSLHAIGCFSYALMMGIFALSTKAHERGDGLDNDIGSLVEEES